MPTWPAGYPSAGAWTFTNVTKAATFWPLLDTLSITELHPDGIMPMVVEVEDAAAALTFDHDDEVVVTFAGQKVWAGHLKIPGEDFLADGAARKWRLVGQDYTAKLDDDVIVVSSERPRETITSRVNWILSKLDAIVITTTNVNLPGETVEPNSHEGETVREALQRIADEKGLHFYLDFDKDLHMFRSEIISAPFALTDSPDYSLSFPYTEYSRIPDSVELTNAIRVHGRRHKRWVTDAASIATYGRQESSIVDPELRTLNQVYAAGQRRLNQLDLPITEGRLICHEPGLRAGHLVNIVNSDWSIDDNFVITSLEITAVDPHDGSGDAHLRSEVLFTDRRLVGRFPGSGKDDKDDNRPPGPGRPGQPGGGGPGSCCDPILISGAPLIDWEECTPTAETTPTQVSTAGNDDTGASVTFPIPNGVKTVDNVVIVHMAWFVNPWPTDPANDDGGISAAMAAAGWTAEYTNAFRATNVFQNVFRRRIDGTEGGGGGWPTTGATQTIATTATSVSIMTVSEMTSGIITTGNVFGDLAASATNNPPHIGNPYATNTKVRWFATVLTRSAAITSNPTGASGPYTTVDSEQSVVDGIHTYRLRVAAISGDAQPENPSAFGGAGGLLAYTMVVGGEVKECSEIGNIAAGPTWEGGNELLYDGGTEPGYSVSGGVLTVTENTLFKVLGRYAIGPPDLPTSLDDWTIEQDFTLDVAGSLTDAGNRYIEYGVDFDDFYVGFRARFGDSSRVQGVEIDGAVDVFAAKDIVEGELHTLKFRLSGGVAYAKMWRVSDGEPASWDVTTSDFEPALDPILDGLDRFYLAFLVGNDGVSQSVILPPPRIYGGALPGDSVDWERVGFGDGSTVQFSTFYQYVESSLAVRIDGQLLQPSAIAAKDGTAQTFDLTRAPYGDPDVGDTGSAVVEARYVRAA